MGAAAFASFAEAAPQTGDLVRRVRQLSVDLGRIGHGALRTEPAVPFGEPVPMPYVQYSRQFWQHQP